jgi:hypothetical protein
LTDDTDLLREFLEAAQTFDELLVEPRKAIEPAIPSLKTLAMSDPIGGKIGQGLEQFIEVYPVSRSRAFGIDTQLWGILQDLQERLKSLPVLQSHPTVHVSWSVGKGNWARVPWIALLDSRLTTTTENGVYIVFLFREDMSGVYLTLAQGITEPKKEHGAAAGLQIVRERAATIRATCESLLRYGFQLDLDIDLHTNGSRGLDYEASVIAYKLYERGKVPNDVLLAEDLKALVTAYDEHITSQSDAGIPDEDGEMLPTAAPPPPYSLSDALAELFMEEDEL